MEGKGYRKWMIGCSVTPTCPNEDDPLKNDVRIELLTSAILSGALVYEIKPRDDLLSVTFCKTERPNEQSRNKQTDRHADKRKDIENRQMDNKQDIERIEHKQKTKRGNQQQNEMTINDGTPKQTELKLHKQTNKQTERRRN